MSGNQSEISRQLSIARRQKLQNELDTLDAREDAEQRRLVEAFIVEWNAKGPLNSRPGYRPHAIFNEPVDGSAEMQRATALRQATNGAKPNRLTLKKWASWPTTETGTQIAKGKEETKARTLTLN